MRRLIVVPSSTAHNDTARHVKARNAYRGLQYERRRRYAETFGASWLVFSARLGLLIPDEKIDPRYRPTKKIEVDPTTLRRQLEKANAASFDVIEVLGGQKYYAAMLRAAKGLPPPVVAPLVGRSLTMGGYALEIHRRILEGQPFPL